MYVTKTILIEILVSYVKLFPIFVTIKWSSIYVNFALFWLKVKPIATHVKDFLYILLMIKDNKVIETALKVDSNNT